MAREMDGVKAERTIFMIAFTHVRMTNYTHWWLSWIFFAAQPSDYHLNGISSEIARLYTFSEGEHKQIGDFFGWCRLCGIVCECHEEMDRKNAFYSDEKCIFKWAPFISDYLELGVFSSCTALRCDPTQSSERARCTISAWKASSFLSCLGSFFTFLFALLLLMLSLLLTLLLRAFPHRKQFRSAAKSAEKKPDQNNENTWLGIALHSALKLPCRRT